MADDHGRSQVHTQVYYQAGEKAVKVNFTQAVESPDVKDLVEAGRTLAEALVEAGFSPDYPASGVEGDDEVAVISDVMRRVKAADGTTIIDFYPPEGKWKFTSTLTTPGRGNIWRRPSECFSAISRCTMGKAVSFVTYVTSLKSLN